MESIVRVVNAIAGNRPLSRVVMAYAGVRRDPERGVDRHARLRLHAGWGDDGRGGRSGAAGPAALVAPLAAALADRRAPTRVLAGGYVVQVAAMLATAAAIAADLAPAAYAGAVVASAAVATTRPAQAVIVPALVSSAEELTAANAVAGWVESAGAVVSSLATGILLAVSGPGWVFAAGGLVGLASVVLVGGVRGVRPPRGTTRPAARSSCSPGSAW